MTKEQLQDLSKNYYHFSTSVTVFKLLDHLISKEEQPAEPKKRWRAEKGSDYYVADNDGIVRSVRDMGNFYDDARYECCNYFRTREEATAAAAKVRDLLLSL